MTLLRALPIGMLVLAGTAGAQPSATDFLTRAACGARDVCRVEEVRDAGRDAEGWRLRVARLLLSPPTHPHADGSPAPDGDCARFEWTLVVGEGAAARARPLVEICNDGYGARGIGEDAVEVHENRFVHTRVGGSAWGWSETTALSLSPLVVIAHETSGWWSLGPNLESRSTEPGRLYAAGRWLAPRCAEDGQPPLAHELPEVRWVAVPRVSLGPRELSALREGASLGTCAAVIDGSATNGAVLAGSADPASATVRALWPTGGPLVIEIGDDVVNERDRVEVWMGGERPSYMETCRDPSEVIPARGFAIEVRSGRVIPLAGDLAPRVERSRDGARFFVALPPDVLTLSIAYEDADRGEVSRRIASSTLAPEDSATLGETASFPNASCTLEDGALHVVTAPSAPPSGPVVPAS